MKGIDTTRLAAWMDAVGLGHGPLSDMAPIHGGTQNVLVRFRRDDREYVLRRPPLHKRAESDDTMRREARVLSGLAATDVPHPRLVAACDDVEVLGATFYLMEPVDGVNITAHAPEALSADRALRHGWGLAMARAAAALARVDLAAAGLADLGRPEGWLERQVARWQRRLASYAAFDGYGAHALPGVDEVAAWLEARRPASWRVGLMHGDFHLANVLFSRDSPEVAAVVDWELATTGDPLLDLGQLLATWPQPGEPQLLRVHDADAMPSRDELVACYAAHSDRDLADLPWFRVLACFRLAVILEGTHARACAGLAPRSTGEELHAMAVALLDQAGALIK